MTITLPTGTRNAMCDAACVRADAGAGPGTIQIRTGAKPASANSAATGTLLATVTLADPAFTGSVSGSSPLADPASVNAVANGTAGWFRLLDSNSNTVMDGTVTQTGGGGDLTLATTSITTGLGVDLTGGTFTVPSGE